LWNIDDGKLISTFRGHKAEIVCLSFDPLSFYLVTGSMDKTAILWNLETEQLLMKIDGHQGEVISISFNTDGDKILTGSFDYTSKVKLLMFNNFCRCGIITQENLFVN
jgi:dynein assembly factor with WDR repeat domains 1